MPADAADDPPLRNGDILVREYQTSGGVVDLLAEVQVDDRTLHLKHIAVYPRESKNMSIGTREAIEVMRRGLAAEARALGFERLRISGVRFSGARPGKKVDFTINLTRTTR